MNVDDVIANCLEFFLDELCLGFVVVAEGDSKNLVHIKPRRTPQGLTYPGLS